MWRSACFPQRHHFAPLVSSLFSPAQEFPLAAGQCLQSSLVYNHQRGLSGRGCCGTVLLICVTSGNTKLSYWNLPLVFCALRFYFYKTNLVICPLFSKWKRRKFWVTPLTLSMNPPVGLIFTLVVVFCSSRKWRDCTWWHIRNSSQQSCWEFQVSSKEPGLLDRREGGREEGPTAVGVMEHGGQEYFFWGTVWGTCRRK